MSQKLYDHCNPTQFYGLSGTKEVTGGPDVSLQTLSLFLSLYEHCFSISLSLCLSLPRSQIPSTSSLPFFLSLSYPSQALLLSVLQFPFLSAPGFLPLYNQQVRLFIMLILLNFPPAKSLTIFTQLSSVAVTGPEQRQIKHFIK